MSYRFVIASVLATIVTTSSVLASEEHNRGPSSPKETRQPARNRTGATVAGSEEAAVQEAIQRRVHNPRGRGGRAN